MTSLHPMQRFAEPLRMTGTHGDRRGTAAGGKRRTGAQPLTPSTKGMLDGGEGTTDLRDCQPCIGPFAHGDQARRAQGSRGPGDQRGDARSPMSSTTRVRDPLDQHTLSLVLFWSLRYFDMVSIPQHVQDFLPGKMGWVATSSSKGEPNATPKGSVRVLDDQHIVFADLFSLKTRANLQENPQVAVTVIDPATAKGYQIKGRAEMLTQGPLFEDMTKQLAKAHRALPPMH